MHRPINVYWNLNIKKFVPPRGPPEPGAPCHGIIGILVNPAPGPLKTTMRLFDVMIDVIIVIGIRMQNNKCNAVENAVPIFSESPRKDHTDSHCSGHNKIICAVFYV